MRRATLVFCAVLAVPLPAGAVPFVIEDVNAGAAPRPNAIWGIGEVGWVYTPSLDYELIGVNTKFLDYSMFPDGQAVGLEVYDAAPIAGGALLRSTQFAAHAGVFVGGTFAPLSLVAGQDYFVGFRNVLFLGVNETADSAAVTLPFYSSILNNGTYDSTIEGCACSAPILQFLANDTVTVSEPGTVTLIGVSVVMLLMLGANVAFRQQPYLEPPSRKATANRQFVGAR